jgi:hypothetical protein
MALGVAPACVETAMLTHRALEREPPAGAGAAGTPLAAFLPAPGAGTSAIGLQARRLARAAMAAAT